LKKIVQKAKSKTSKFGSRNRKQSWQAQFNVPTKMLPLPTNLSQPNDTRKTFFDIKGYQVLSPHQ